MERRVRERNKLETGTIGEMLFGVLDECRKKAIVWRALLVEIVEPTVLVVRATDSKPIEVHNGICKIDGRDLERCV